MVVYETDGHSFDVYRDLQKEILRKDGMDRGEALRNLELAAWNNYDISISDIIFLDGKPSHCHRMFFDYLDIREMVDNAICKLAEMSLTHRLMFVKDVGEIYVTKSENHQTNIDSEFLEAVSAYYLKEKRTMWRDGI